MDAGSVELGAGPLRAVLEPEGPELRLWLDGEPVLGPLVPVAPPAFQSLLGRGPDALSRGDVRGLAGPAQRLEWLAWTRGGAGLRWCVDVCDAGSGVAVQLSLENRGGESLALESLCPLRGSTPVGSAAEQELWRDERGPGRESLAFAPGPAGTTLLAGFVTGRIGFGVGRLGEQGLACESWLGSRTLLPGESLQSDRAWLGIATSPSEAIEVWARRAGLEMQARVPGRPALLGAELGGLEASQVTDVGAEAGLEPRAWRDDLEARRAGTPGALLSARGPLLASAGWADALRLGTRDGFELAFVSQRLGLLDLDLRDASAPGLAPVLAGLIGGLVRAPSGGAAAARELLRRALPPLGREARRVAPGVLRVQLRGERVAVVLYDAGDPPRRLGASLDLVGVAGPAHGYDFFADEDLGLLTTGIPPREAAADGVRLVALTPPAARPQVIGSNLHVGMGTAEVAALRSEGDSLVLVLRHPGLHDGDVWIARPGEPKAQRVPVRFEDRAEVIVPAAGPA